ncbi:MAG: tetratricopeptide repeat protein [Bacteroidetes bacterium]|nr:tetratricopeptide repeat protein [Bacteroidota bacterium]
MKKIKLNVLILYVAAFITIVGIGILIYTFFIGKTEVSNLIAGVLSIILGLIGILYATTFSNEPVPINIDLPTATKLADDKLVKEIALRDKTIVLLKEELARKNIPTWEQTVKDYLEEDELQKAIESIDTNASDEESAQKHIRKAQLYITNFQFAEAEQHYKQAVAILPSYHNNYAIADFYYNLNRFPEAIVYYTHCLRLATSPEDRAVVLHNLGLAQHGNNNYSAAEISFNEALKTFNGSLNLFKVWGIKNSEEYLSAVATTLNNLGALQRGKHDYLKAEEYYNEALKIQKELAKKNDEKYLPDIVYTLNNIGHLQNNKHEYSKAEESYKEALKMQRKLVEKDREQNLYALATILNNIGILQRDNHEYSKAEESFNEALKIKMEIAEKNNEASLPDIADTLNNLGAIQKDKHEYSKAEEYYNKALKIRKELAKKNREAYITHVASLLNNIGILQMEMHEYSKAEESFNEALKIRRGLTKKNSETEYPYLANTLVGIAELYQDGIYNKELSLKYAREAIEICDKCNNTPFVQRILAESQLVVEKWNNK